MVRVWIADMTVESRTRYPLFLAMAVALLMGLFVAKAGPEAVGGSKPVKRLDPVILEIEGWRVHIDSKMLEGEHSAAGARALMMPASNLLRITIMIPEERLKQLQTIGIWIGTMEARRGGFAAAATRPGRPCYGGMR